MKRLLLLAVAVVCAAVLMSVVPALADDVTINTTFTGLDAQQFTHNDLTPFKGWATIYAYNSSGVAWTDFHFQIVNIGQSVANVDFIDYAPYAPSSTTNTLDSWSINNAPTTGATMDLYFSSNPVAANTLAMFKVYTDNTTDHVNFGLMIWPTTAPVPEPSSVLALSSGLLGLAGLALRRRR